MLVVIPVVVPITNDGVVVMVDVVMAVMVVV